MFQQLSAELSSHTVLSAMQSNTELIESFRTAGQMAFYLTRLAEGYLYEHKTRMDIFAQVASIYLVTGEGAVAFRKPDGCEGIPEPAARK